MIRDTLEDRTAAPQLPARGAAAASKLGLPLQIVDDPGSLFERNSSGWRAAFFLALTAALVVGGTLLKLPAFAHVSGVAAAGPSSPIGLSWIAALLATIQLVCAAGAIGVLFALTAIVRSAFKLDGSIGQYWCAVCAIGSVALGLAAFADGLIIRCVPVQTFTSMSQLGGAVPSLATLLPAAPHKLYALLSLVDPFKLWTFALVAILFSTLGRAPRSRAIAGAALVTLLPAALYALLA